MKPLRYVVPITSGYVPSGERIAAPSAGRYTVRMTAPAASAARTVRVRVTIFGCTLRPGLFTPEEVSSMEAAGISFELV